MEKEISNENAQTQLYGQTRAYNKLSNKYPKISVEAQESMFLKDGISLAVFNLFFSPKNKFQETHLFSTCTLESLDGPAVRVSPVQTGGPNPYCPGSVPGVCMHQGIRQHRQAEGADVAGLEPTENRDKLKYRRSLVSPTVCCRHPVCCWKILQKLICTAHNFAS